MSLNHYPNTCPKASGSGIRRSRLPLPMTRTDFHHPHAEGLGDAQAGVQSCSKNAREFSTDGKEERVSTQSRRLPPNQQVQPGNILEIVFVMCQQLAAVLHGLASEP